MISDFLFLLYFAALRLGMHYLVTCLFVYGVYGNCKRDLDLLELGQ